jgi:hypothetical protein
MGPDDIRRLCATIADFSAAADLRFKAMPVITWSFATTRDLNHARANLMQCLSGDLMPMSKEQVERVRGRICEIDCYGVTFRLEGPKVI